MIVKDKEKDKSSQDSLGKEVRRFLILKLLDLIAQSFLSSRSHIFLNSDFLFVSFSFAPITKNFSPLHSKICMLINKNFDVAVVINFVSESVGSVNESSSLTLTFLLDRSPVSSSKSKI